jgi:hypothetical protein
MVRPAVLALSVLALAAAGCGGDDHDHHDDATDARKAAETYVRDLGSRDGEAVCRDMTKSLQRQFTDAVARANPEVAGQGCGRVMTTALRSIPAEQLDRFASAKIENVETDGSSGSFTYRLGDIRVDGKVAKEDGDWKVSCCVPGQGGG